MSWFEGLWVVQLFNARDVAAGPCVGGVVSFSWCNGDEAAIVSDHFNKPKFWAHNDRIPDGYVAWAIACLSWHGRARSSFAYAL